MPKEIQGAHAIMDEILIGAKTPKEQDEILRKVIRATDYNLKLNFDKCQVKQTRVEYVGHVISENGLKPDPEKTRAVSEMPTPESKDVRRFLDFVQYLSESLTSARLTPHYAT